jgi:hypothetical protein
MAWVNRYQIGLSGSCPVYTPIREATELRTSLEVRFVP